MHRFSHDFPALSIKTHQIPKFFQLFPAKWPTKSPMFCRFVGGPFPGVAMQALSPRPQRWLRKAKAWAVATSPQEMLLSGTRMRSLGENL